MSVVPVNFKITPPKVKPQRGTGMLLLVFRPLVCILGPSLFPLVVYLLDGFTNVFFWMLGFGSIVSLILLIFDHGKVKIVTQYMKRICYCVIYKRKLLQVPSYYNDLSPFKSNSAQNLPACVILDGFDVPQSTNPTFVDIPISIDCPFSSSSFGELNEGDISQKFTILTPTKRRTISAGAVSFSPVKNQTESTGKRSPFSKRRLGFPGCMSPGQLKDTCQLPTILESPYVGINVETSQSRRPNCFSS